MTIKQAADYDGQVAPWRFGYSKAASSGNWVLAAHFVFLLNSCLTPENRIDDLPRFSIRPKSFEEKSKMTAVAMEFCFENMPIVEMASSNERSKLYNSYRSGM